MEESQIEKNDAEDGGETETVNIVNLEVGQELSGFTVEYKDYVTKFEAELVSFKHAYSGAAVVCIANEDQNRAFNIAYRTPYQDERDINHIFEHAVLTSSKKYPSKDIFFDMANKSYSTYINAHTYPIMTCFPLSSMSEEQLCKMMDVYLSLVTEPDFLENENFFKREALRYCLEDMESPITMEGIIFAEDNGNLTDTSSEALNNLMDSLFLGETAANSIGRLHRNYEGLTYEDTIALFEQYYHFDNAVILLYGDLDYGKMLEFLDREYLSKYEDSHTDLSAWIDGKTPAGYVEQTFESPAYEGDQTEQASVINYGIDLSSCSWKELEKLDLIAGMMSQEDSLLMRNLRAAGIMNEVYCGVEIGFEKPIFLVQLENTDEDQKEIFKQVVRDSLAGIARDGFSDEIYQAVLKGAELSDVFAMEGTGIGVDQTIMMALYWKAEGSCDYYETERVAFSELSEDSSQTQVKELVAMLANPERSALVVTVPRAGMAEEILAQREAYLADMKSSMGQEELEALIRETEEFDEWNAEDQSNVDFMIPVEDLPEPEPAAEVVRTEKDGITFFTSPANIEQAGSYFVSFNAAGLEQEELYYLALLDTLFGELDTEHYRAEEIETKISRDFYNLSISGTYPMERGSYHHPYFTVSWQGLTEDYEAQLELILEILQNADYRDTEKISQALERYLPSYDLAKVIDMNVAAGIAFEPYDSNLAFENYLSGQGYYRFLTEVQERLRTDPGYGEELAESLEKTAEKVLTRDCMLVAIAAKEEETEELKEATSEILGVLPESVEDKTASWQFMQDALQTGKFPFRAAVIAELPDQMNLAAAPGDAAGFEGKYAAFVEAVTDKYLIPKLRFDGGAYSAGLGYDVSDQLFLAWSVNDAGAGSTLDLYAGIADALRNMKLDQQELDGYILSAYGGQNQAAGPLRLALREINRIINGMDSAAINARISDIRNARVEDQAEAAEALERAFAEGYYLTVGNEGRIQEEAEGYEEIVNYKEKK